MKEPSELHEKLRQVIETVHRLRAPGGCPWDQEQTHQTLRPFLIEEAYEVLDVLDAIGPDTVPREQVEPLKEELGDLLLQILLHCEIANESKAFDLGDVADRLRTKLVERHPHVFESAPAQDANEALQNWESRKAAEKKKKGKTLLSDLPKNLPALAKTSRVIEKVSKVGFQWPDLRGPTEKLEEEWNELQTEMNRPQPNKQRVEEELGDLLFCVCNLSHFLKINPENALRTSTAKFGRRFEYIEKKIVESGRTLKESSLEEMDRFWEDAKKNAE